MRREDLDSYWPGIGVTVFVYPEYAGRRLRDDYWRRLAAAGALPLLLPPLAPELAPEMAARIDGLLLTGGGDFPPNWYGQGEQCPVRAPDPERDLFELALIRACWRLNKPMLGICRGMQAMNLALGGTLHQDLEGGKNAKIVHDQSAPRQETSHQLRITHHGLSALLGEEIAVNSHHHQAVALLAAVFEAAAYAPDGVIEAIVARDPARYALGVQWHPEALPPPSPLFADLVRAARKHRRRPGGKEET